MSDEKECANCGKSFYNTGASLGMYHFCGRKCLDEYVERHPEIKKGANGVFIKLTKFVSILCTIFLVLFIITTILK